MSVWRALPVVALLFSMSPAIAEEVRNPLTESETWEDLKYDVVGDAEILDGSDRLAFEAPFRAHDAATVPITIKEIDGDGPDFVRLTLIVDENPAPIAAEFSFGPAMGEIDLEARVRVDAYTNVRAIAETADGEFYMVGRYVRASGGCSAPSLKDSEAALANIGKMRLRLFDLKDIQKKTASLQSGARREAQIMMRHPNYSGFQRNQLTHLFVLMERMAPGILAKIGADGVSTAIVPEHELGIALKIDDGDKVAAEVALGAVLNTLGVLPKGESKMLADYFRPSITNSRGESVGRVEPSSDWEAMVAKE